MAKGKERSKSKEAFWRRLIGRHERSGLTIREFCREHGQRETAFYFWRRELARREHLTDVMGQDALQQPHRERRIAELVKEKEGWPQGFAGLFVFVDKC